MSKGGRGKPSTAQRWIQLQLELAARADLERLSGMIGRDKAIALIDDYQSKLADSETRRNWFKFRGENNA